MVGRTLGHYEILEPLGAGGMGEVYRARDTKLDRDVAIKVLPEDFATDQDRLARFEREAKLLASLNHANIAAIYGIEDEGDQRFIAMELVEGETLAERITGTGGIEIDVALDIAGQIAEALEAAHENGIVHRDLKPANVKLTSDGKVKVLDFGLAKASAPDGDSSEPVREISHSPTIAEATRAGVILGTAPYMSPEQARGNPVDKRSDIWSFGAVLYEMLSGKKAFDGETVSDTMAAILKEDPDWRSLPPETPPALLRLLRRCLRQSLRDRLHDIADARIVLRECGDDTAAPSVPGAVPETRRAGWTSLLPWAVAAMTTLVALATWNATVPTRPRPISPISFEVTGPPIALGANAPLDNTGSALLAISRDGAQIVYVGAEQGSIRLYHRRLSDPEVEPIPGTEGATNPFFSPNGEQLGFAAGGELQQVSLQGGNPRSLAVEKGWRGGTWLPDDTIIAALGTNVVLTRVGDELRDATERNIEAGERTHRWPRVLPDGRNLLYTVGTWDIGSFDEAHIVLENLDTGVRRPLADGSYPIHVPGYILFSRTGALWALPFDDDRLEVTGSPELVLDGIATHPLSGTAVVDVAANGTLVYVPGGPIEPLRRLTWVDRSGQRSPVTDELRPFQQVRTSPDGDYLAVEIDRATSQIWILPLANPSFVPLTRSWSNDSPIWHPDGEHVTFLINREDGRSIVWQATGGEEAELLVGKDGVGAPTSWSADGTALLYDVGSPATGLDVWRLRLGDRDQSPLLQERYDESQAIISPNGRWVAYVSNETGQSQVWIRAYPGLDSQQSVSIDGGTDPRWRHDGSEIIYRDADGIVAVAVQGDDSLRMGARTRLFEGEFDEYDVAPNDDRILVSERSENESTYRIIVVVNWLEELKRLVPTGGS